MWTLKELGRLTKEGENLHLEFKKKANFPEKIVKELVAFANTDGGVLLIGVDDDGTVSGTRDIDGEIFAMEEAIEKLIRPTLSYDKHIVKINEKKAIAVFEIPKSQKPPHFIKSTSSTQERKAYVRYKDQSLQASREMREIMRRRTKAKDIQFTFGDKEQKLMEILDASGFTTLKQFAKEANIRKFVASRTLIRLVLANVLNIVPHENEDHYVRK